MHKFSFVMVMTIGMIFVGCSASGVNTAPASIGKPATMADLLAVADFAGPIKFEKHIVANWAVPLSGLLDLDHPKAVAAGLTERDEPIQIFTYTLQHPEYGTYLIDSGVSESFLDAKNNPDISFLVKKAMNISAIEVLLTTKELVAKYPNINGVLLTHIHLDHIMGLTDIDENTPIFTGPGEAVSSSLQNLATRGSTDRLLASVKMLREWQFAEDGVVDVFGDGSLWAISSPGHTPGTTAYLVRSTNGPQLLIGDVTHTRWGWDNTVGPGSYSIDGDTGSVSLQKLKTLVASKLNIKVHPGHQN